MLRYVERFHIYVQTIGNLAAGATVEDVPLTLDSDAPFLLRGRGGRVQNDPQFYQAGMNSLLVSYRDASGRLSSDSPVPLLLDIPGNGLGGKWKPVRGGKFFPIHSTIQTTVSNTGPGAVDLVNLQFYYVGVKKYPAGRQYYTFPDKFSVRPYDYMYWSKTPSGAQIAGQTALMGVSEQRLQNPIQIYNDADFCMLGGACGIFGVQSLPYFYMELFARLLDENYQPYMNAPVHVDWLFGSPHQSVVATEGDYYLPNNSQSIINPAAPLSAGWIPGQTPLTGPWHPGLFYPQIYIPGNHNFYLDLIRNDAAYTTAYGSGGSTTPITPQSVNFCVRFQGLKVFPSR